MYVYGKNMRKYDKEQPPTIQAVQEQGTMAFVQKQGTKATNLSKAPTTLALKWLIDKPVLVEQWPLTTEKLLALEQLIPEQLNAQQY